jgi:hypothetical protein
VKRESDLIPEHDRTSAKRDRRENDAHRDTCIEVNTEGPGAKANLAWTTDEDLEGFGECHSVSYGGFNRIGMQL